MTYKIIKKIVIGIVLIHSVSIGDMIVIEVVERVQSSPGVTDFNPVYVVTNTQPYVTGVGGIVFYVSLSFFSETPRVTLAIEDTSMILTTTNIVSAWISQNSSTQTTVMVVTDDGEGGYTEAPNGINVHLHATARP